MGLTIAMGLRYFIFSHQQVIASAITQARLGEHATSFPVDAKGLATPTKLNYVYRVIGPAGVTAKITWVNQSATTGQDLQARLPWSVATTTNPGVDFPAGAGQPAYVDIRLNTHGKSATVTCQAFDHGVLYDQETSTGVDMVLTCGTAL